MNYELVKKLKDAGFPQEGFGMWWDGKVFTTKDIYSDLYLPTLSELIEACGENFISLDLVNKRDDYKWEACCKYCCCNEHGEGRHYIGGKTPEEAVANLWLAIN